MTNSFYIFVCLIATQTTTLSTIITVQNFEITHTEGPPVVRQFQYNFNPLVKHVPYNVIISLRTTVPSSSHRKPLCTFSSKTSMMKYHYSRNGNKKLYWKVNRSAQKSRKSTPLTKTERSLIIK